MFIYSKCLQYGCNLKDRYFDDQQGIKIKIFMPQHFLKRVGQEIFRNRNSTNANCGVLIMPQFMLVQKNPLHMKWSEMAFQ